MTDYRAEQERFNDAVVEKIRSDPDFLGHLLLNPEVVLEQAGLTEMARATEERTHAEDDVEGHHRQGQRNTYYGTCHWHSWPYKYHRH